MSLTRILFLLVFTFSSLLVRAKDVVVTKYGAIGDGLSLNTAAIQKAIDECSLSGGGKVLFPAGIWLSGTILLKDNVTIDLDEKAILSGSTNIDHYLLVDGFKDGRGSSMGYCFVGARDVKNVGISGKGKIIGNGKALLDKNGRGKRPFLIRFVRCTNVVLSEVYMEGPVAWTLHLFECKNVLADRIIIRSRGLSNNDGIDIDCCDQVVIRNCDIDSGDDAICLKTTGPKPCKNIEISGCTINTGQAAFKLGTESAGNFENINIHHCTVKETKGIKLYSVDGAHLKNLRISDITIEKTTLPILLRLGARLKTFREGELSKPVGVIEGVNIHNVTVKNAVQMAFLISGIPGHLIKDVHISNINVHLPGGGTAAEASVVLPENEADYPEVTMFGKTMPAYGMYIRHAANIKMENIKISLEQPDARPAIIGLDLAEIKLNNWTMPATSSAEPFITLDESKNVSLTAIQPSKQPATFLSVTGKSSKGITLDGISQAQDVNTTAILSPAPKPEPRINGPKVFGVRPNQPILFTIPASGNRPMVFSVKQLPKGVKVDAKTGRISGSVDKPGTYTLHIEASNSLGKANRDFKIIVGEEVALTPPMGWNHYNIYGTRITQEQVSTQAKAMASTGLINHGWSYLNIDDGWQGKRGGKYHAILPDSTRFPNMQQLVDEVHDLGLKIGTYSTPWVESYGHRIGGSAMNAEGTFERTKENIPRNKKQLPYAIGTYHFWENDARQFVEWGFDYLKYDWNPIEFNETKAMYDALRNSGRDVVYSLSNSTPFETIAEVSTVANAWRTGGDIKDNWKSLKSRIFTQDKWAKFARPGHWNDPDMMILGVVGWNSVEKWASKLTPDEQYTHMSAWCLMSVPLLLGNDISKLDAFTLSLLTNDEVLEVSQDPLGKQATVIARAGDIGIMAKDMEDGSKAAGLFNLADDGEQEVSIKWTDLGIKGKYKIRDLWRQKDLGVFENEFKAQVPQHGVVMIRLFPIK